MLTLSGFAQNITGVITDEKGKPIAEANIISKATGNHTHTDDQGNFIFEDIDTGDRLQISHLGFVTRTIEIENNTDDLTIILYSKSLDLDEIVIEKNINALHIITDIDLQTTPVNSSQDVLRTVPGLFIGQHAGGGKAEQIFLRGFDIDHGTDINISVDGLPVNMVSHAHGQGYADLHFVIPETIDAIDFGKGPYYQNKGNFTTAGYVDFQTKDRLENSVIKVEAGQFNTQRLMGMFNVLNTAKHSAYIASEYLATDGPFDSPQNFNRINVFGKYTGYINNTDRLGFTISHFTSDWDASGQIPQRAVDSGLIGRFGAIDDTEGGETSRTNLIVNYDKFIDENSSIKNTVFMSKYDFELYSNFTFFLDDPINGDQIKQKESRTIYGVNSEYRRNFNIGDADGILNAGLSLRNDQSEDNELSHTLNRTEILERIAYGEVNETNMAAYVGADLNLGKWTFNPSLRLDYFNFQYNDQLQPLYQTQTETEAIVSPKLNIIYHQNDDLQFYLKTGKGFHSNDTRVVVAQNGKQILPAAYGFDAGYIWKPSSKLLVNMAYWYLYLQQEFVYVGDAGIVEPSGKTRRQGVDVSLRYQPLSWLFYNIDANYTHGRAIEEAAGEDFIPLAPDFTITSGLSVVHPSGIYGGAHLRFMDDRPANEDNSIVAEGYTVVDLNAGYKWNNLNFGIQIQNLFDTAWNETQFATESRLQNESQSVEEIHFTPGTPFFAKASIEYSF